MRVLVTGGAGFIGANLCRALVAADEVSEVVVYDNFSTGHRSNLRGVDVRIVEADLLDGQALHEAARGCASIVHLAARPSVPKSIQHPIASHEANATGTLNVLEAARAQGVAHVVVSSSSSVYGSNPVMPKAEDLLPAPMSPYAASKLAGEAYASAYATSYGLKTLVFRFFNVFGRLQSAGHDYAAVVPAFLDAALHGRPLRVFGDGRQTRDFTHVSSVSEVLVRAVLTQTHSETPVNLAFGTRTSLRELIAVIEQSLGASLVVEELPPRIGDVRHSQADSTRLRDLFPDISPVSLRAAIEDTIEWFRSP